MFFSSSSPPHSSTQMETQLTAVKSQLVQRRKDLPRTLMHANVELPIAPNLACFVLPQKTDVFHVTQAKFFNPIQRSAWHALLVKLQVIYLQVVLHVQLENTNRKLLQQRMGVQFAPLVSTTTTLTALSVNYVQPVQNWQPLAQLNFTIHCPIVKIVRYFNLVHWLVMIRNVILV